MKQIEALTEQVRQLTKILYGSKSEKSKYQARTDKDLYLKTILLLLNLSTQKNKARQLLLIPLSVNYIRKNGMILFVMGLKSEEIHHHPKNTQCDCCHHQMTEAGIPLRVKKQNLFRQK